jgi:hypothetical protein
VINPRIARITVNLALALAAVVTTLILLEGGARLLSTPYDGSSNVADTASDQTGWRGKPFYTTTVATGDLVHNLALNSAGMHDTEHQLLKPDETFRILILGDSFVQAVQVPEAEIVHQVLDDRLNELGDSRRYEVISAGVGGWGTGQQLLYYRNEGRYYQPDLVLLMFFLGNDVKDNLPGRGVTVDGLNHYTPYFVLNDGGLDIDQWYYAPGLEPAVGQTPPGWKAWNNLLGRLYQSSRLYAQLEPLVAVEPIKASMLDFYLGQNEIFDYALALTMALVKQLRAEVEQDGAQFGVVLISPVDLIEFSQLDPAGRAEIYQKLPGMRRAEEIDPPNQQFVEQFSQAVIAVLDLFPPFAGRVAETGETLYFTGDKHWNVAGNRLAGEARLELA